MKQTIFSIMLLILTFSGCGPSQKITGSWSDPEFKSQGPYTKAFVMVLSQNPEANFAIESQMAKKLISKGFKVVKSNDIFPPKFSPVQDFTKEMLTEAIRKTGCDAVLVLALLDSKTEEYYNPGTVYSPMGYGHYGSFYGYYDHYYPEVYSPGYYSVDKTFYLEANLYDLAQDKLLWSVQSEARNPSNIPEWFEKYSAMLMNHLKSEGLNLR